MPFTVTPLNAPKPGDLVHFWDVTASLDADTVGPWVATGFDFQDPAVATIVAPAPLSTFCFTVNGSAIRYNGQYAVEISTASQSALIPGYTNPLTGAVVADQTVTVPAGGAWRLVKIAALDSAGSIRVGVGYFPGGVTNNS